MILSYRNYLVYARLTLPTPRRVGRGRYSAEACCCLQRSLNKSEGEHYISSMRCIYKVLFTRVHPEAEKVNTLGKCSPRCSPFSNLRLQVLSLYSLSSLIMGQKLLAQSNTLGIRAISLAICRGKSFQITKIQVQYFLTSFSNLITPFDTKLIFSHENTKEKA